MRESREPKGTEGGGTLKYKLSMKYGSGKLIQNQICQVAVKKLGYSEAAVTPFMGFIASLVNRYPVCVVAPVRTRP